MRFKLIKEGCSNVDAYGLEGLSTGDTFELDESFTEKASNNPDFEKVDGDKPKKSRMTVSKLKRALNGADVDYPEDADIATLKALYEAL